MDKESKNCQNCHNEFVIEPDDFAFYEKMKVPAPTFCSECRLIRRLAWRNEKSLYKNQCKKCDKSIVTVYPKSSGIAVYCRPCWWADNWNELETGLDFDESQNFFSQLSNLFHKAPVPSLFGAYATLFNSEYTNMVNNLKNCYLLTHSSYDEDCMYGSVIENSKNSVDNTMLTDGELCYENVDCQKCYQSMYSVDCENCHNIYFSKNCVGCSDCFGCVNLRSKRYHIFNQPYSKEEYEAKLKEFNINSYKNVKGLKEKTLGFWQQFPQKYMHDRHNASVSGDYIYNSKNTHHSFITYDAEDLKFCAFITAGTKTADSYDFTHFGAASELLYESLQVGTNASSMKFCFFTILDTNNLEYCISSIGCKNCFGCVGLKKKEYCILNKQYSKEEYFALREKIIAHMNANPYVDKQKNTYKYGEFYPIELSPFGYNATTAQELFPLTKDEAVARGYGWQEKEEKSHKVDVSSENLPDTIDDVGEEILSQVIGCEHQGLCNENCSMAFKILPEELKFYKRVNIPLPRLCSNCRHHQRNKFVNPMKLWHRQCMCDKQNHSHGSDHCKTEFETSYAPDRPEIVYCEQCYQAEVA